MRVVLVRVWGWRVLTSGDNDDDDGDDDGGVDKRGGIVRRERQEISWLGWCVWRVVGWDVDLEGREDRLVDLGTEAARVLAVENHPGARAAERLVRGGGDNVAEFERVGGFLGG